MVRKRDTYWEGNSGETASELSQVQGLDAKEKKKSGYTQLSHEIHQNLIIATFLIPMLNPHWFSRPALKQL